MPVGSVGSGKLGRSRCEGFLNCVAFLCRLDTEEWEGALLTRHCCCDGVGRSSVAELNKGLGKNRSLALLSHDDGPRL